jgi:hypothetical protein
VKSPSLQDKVLAALDAVKVIHDDHVAPEHQFPDLFKGTETNPSLGQPTPKAKPGSR